MSSEFVVPTDCLGIILGYLDSGDVAASLCTCKQLRDVGANNPLVPLDRVLRRYNDVRGIKLNVRCPLSDVCWVLEQGTIIVGYSRAPQPADGNEILDIKFTEDNGSLYLHWVIWRRDGVLWVRLDTRRPVPEFDMDYYIWSHMTLESKYEILCQYYQQQSQDMQLDMLRISSDVHWMEMSMSAWFRSDRAAEQLARSDAELQEEMEYRESRALRDSILLEQCYLDDLEEELHERLEEQEREEEKKELQCYQEGADAADVEARQFRKMRGRGKKQPR